MGNLNPQWLGIMLKAVGIGLVVEMGALICTDAGNAALGKTLQLLGAAAVLWLSIPLADSLMELLEQILGGL
jgi:stage III sporulation protein AD